MKTFKNLEHFFSVLNTNIKYVVLRNYETLPYQFDPAIHGDIDLLVEDLQKVVSLTNAKPIFKEPYRVAYLVSFEQGDIQFDFRYVGDNYLDRQWESQILADRQLVSPNQPTPTTPHTLSLSTKKSIDISNAGFYVMSPMNQYFSLLHHAYVQKPNLAIDYPDKLLIFAQKIGATYIDSPKYCIKQLEAFYHDNNYEFVVPSEIGLYVNWDNLKYLNKDTYKQLRWKYRFSKLTDPYKRKLYIKQILRMPVKLVNKLKSSITMS